MGLGLGLGLGAVGGLGSAVPPPDRWAARAIPSGRKPAHRLELGLVRVRVGGGRVRVRVRA